MSADACRAWSLGRSSSPSYRSSPPSRRRSGAGDRRRADVGRRHRDLYPWQVAITTTIDNQDWFCGGTRVAADLVLTAAHCVIDDDGRIAVPSEVAVYSGSTILLFGRPDPADPVDRAPMYFNRATDVALYPGLDLQATPERDAERRSGPHPHPEHRARPADARDRRDRSRSLGRRRDPADHRVGLPDVEPRQHRRLRPAAHVALGERHPVARPGLRLRIPCRLRRRHDALRPRADDAEHRHRHLPRRLRRADRVPDGHLRRARQPLGVASRGRDVLGHRLRRRARSPASTRGSATRRCTRSPPMPIPVWSPVNVTAPTMPTSATVGDVVTCTPGTLDRRRPRLLLRVPSPAGRRLDGGRPVLGVEHLHGGGGRHDGALVRRSSPATPAAPRGPPPARPR